MEKQNISINTLPVTIRIVEVGGKNTKSLTIERLGFCFGVKK